MAIGRFPDRVKAFRKWAQDKVDNAGLSDSATPHKGPSTFSRGRKWRMKRRKRRKRDG